MICSEDIVQNIIETLSSIDKDTCFILAAYLEGRRREEIINYLSCKNILSNYTRQLSETTLFSYLIQPVHEEQWAANLCHLRANSSSMLVLWSRSLTGELPYADIFCTQRKPTQAEGEHANSAEKGPESNPRPCFCANRWATVLPAQQLLYHLLHCLTLQVVLFLELFIFHCLPAAVIPYLHGNHLTLTLSWDHIDFPAGVVAIKTPTWGDRLSQCQCQFRCERMLCVPPPSPGASFSHDIIKSRSLFTNRKSVSLKKTKSLLCPADEVSRLEMGRLMRFSQSVRLAVWTQIKLTHSD